MSELDLSVIEYLPTDPVAYRPRIGVIGCGGISGMHLAAYRAAGYDVVALCDLVLDKAIARRDEFFPAADVYSDVQSLLARDDIEVVDIATHVDVRPGIVAAALAAGKHVLSQKPFVRDIAEGESLIRLAEQTGRRLAVNQNGRWAPHFAFLLAAVRAGTIGTVSTADFEVYWPHDVTFAHDPNFATMEDLVLYDFGIHWFDVIAQLFSGITAVSVTAVTGTMAGQVIPVPTAASVIITFESGQATLLFRAASHYSESGGYRVEGSDGVIEHRGESLGGEHVSVTTAEATATLALDGTWWDHGMHGTMGELLSAIEADRSPSNDAATSLPGLRLCFAAVESSRTGRPVDPRTVVASPL